MACFKRIIAQLSQVYLQLLLFFHVLLVSLKWVNLTTWHLTTASNFYKQVVVRYFGVKIVCSVCVMQLFLPSDIELQDVFVYIASSAQQTLFTLFFLNRATVAASDPSKLEPTLLKSTYITCLKWIIGFWSCPSSWDSAPSAMKTQWKRSRVDVNIYCSDVVWTRLFFLPGKKKIQERCRVDGAWDSSCIENTPKEKSLAKSCIFLLRT